MSLSVARYYSAARTGTFEVYRQPANLGVRWALPGGLQRLEFSVRKQNYFSGYRAYENQLGDGVALFDTPLYRPVVDGWIYEVVPDGRHVHYICAGGWKRMSDQYETGNPSATTDHTDVYLKSVLTNHAPAISTDQSNIDDTGTDIGEYRVDEIQGATPQEIVRDLLKMGTSTGGEILDFWLVPARLDGTDLQAPLPYLKARASGVGIDYQVNRRDLRDLDFSRHIWGLANDVETYYTFSTQLTNNENGNATTITVDDGSGFAEGNGIVIFINGGGSHKTIVDGVTGNDITIEDGLPALNAGNPVANAGNRVYRENLTTSGGSTDATSQGNYWQRQRHEVLEELDQTQDSQYEDILLNTYKNPVQQAAFTIGSRTIKEISGPEYPLWRMLINPGWIRVNDLFPAASLATLSLDALRVFRIVALDYDHTSRTMRVVPDNIEGDSRLDVILQRAGFGIGQIVQRAATGTAWST